MKIGFITTMAGSPWGGSEFLWAHTAKQALLDGDEVYLSIFDWSIEHPEIIELKKLGAKIFPRPRFEQSSSVANSHLISFFECKADALLISQGSSYDILAYAELVKLLDTCRMPYFVICQFNSDDVFLSDLDRSYVYQFFSQAQKVAFVAHRNLDFAQRHLASHIDNAMVVQNPVNLSDSSYLDYPLNLGLRFACVARLEVQCKGQDILLETLSTGVWKQRDWSCHLYGSGPDETYLQELSIHYGLAENVQFMGHVNDIRRVWAENHILILPSRGEGTPLSLVEAMLCGRPAIVTNVGGNSAWIEEGRTGFIAESPTVKHLHGALDKAWSNRNEWENMGRIAHMVAKNKIDPNPGRTLLKSIRKQRD